MLMLINVDQFLINQAVLYDGNRKHKFTFCLARYQLSQLFIIKWDLVLNIFYFIWHLCLPRPPKKHEAQHRHVHLRCCQCMSLWTWSGSTSCSIAAGASIQQSGWRCGDSCSGERSRGLDTVDWRRLQYNGTPPRSQWLELDCKSPASSAHSILLHIVFLLIALRLVLTITQSVFMTQPNYLGVKYVSRSLLALNRPNSVSWVINGRSAIWHTPLITMITITVLLNIWIE